MALPLAIGWALLILPLNILTYAFFRWRCWNRFLTLSIQVPSLAISIWLVGELVRSPPTIENRFWTKTRRNIPTGLRFHDLGHGGFGVFFDRYFFETTPDETARIIRSLSLSGPRPDEVVSRTPIKGQPPFSSWNNPSVYSVRHPDGLTLYMVTDEAMTNLYLEVSRY